MKILYVEDTPLHIRAMQKIALMAGCEFISAATGREALNILTHPPHLVIVDWILPDISGLELVIQIRKTNIDLPIIAVSASTLAEDREQALTAGCVEFIAKPFRFLEMVEHLKTYKTSLVGL